jgi:hypothetical protein
MSVYRIAFILSSLSLAALAFIQITMRRQVHGANYGHQEISPWDVRYANDMGNIWRLHKRAFERSALRSWFIVLFVAWIGSSLLAVVGFVVSR